MEVEDGHSQAKSKPPKRPSLANTLVPDRENKFQLSKPSTVVVVVSALAMSIFVQISLYQIDLER